MKPRNARQERVEMKRKTVKATALVTLASALALGSYLPTAMATKTVKRPSHISIKSSGLKFSGNVTSSNATCDGGRKVTLYRTPSQKLGSTTTNGAGAWKLTLPGSAGITLGHFYATVKQRSEGTAGTIYVCKAARSKTISYKP
jgi:hypothetical protein